ncbi:MAG: hypothetical protein WHS86_10450 [Desulfosoma sp.]
MGLKSSRPVNIVVCLAALGAVALRFYLLQDQKLSALSDARYDSRLFIDLARSIAASRWLGPYDERTLVKGPFYPLWIAAAHHLHLPLLKTQHALYVLSAGSAAWALARRLGSVGALFLFMVLLFHPTSYAAHTAMVLREYVFQSLAVLVVSLAVLLFQEGEAWGRGRMGLAVLLGLTLGCFWLTREESVWIVPFYAVAAGHFLWRRLGAGEDRKKDLFKSAFFVVIPLLVLGLTIGCVSAVNKAWYGIWETVEVKSSFFRDAYGALSRVQPEVFKPAVPVPRDVRMKLYDASPSFRELRPFLEREDSVWTCALFYLKRASMAGTLDPATQRGIDFVLSHDASGVWRAAWDKADKEPCDIYGAWFVWALREAAAAAGHHKSAPAARAYYEKLALEINAACDEKRIPCGPHRSSLAPPWRWDDLRPVALMFARILHLGVSLEGLDLMPPYSTGDAPSIALFRLMTREEPMPSRDGASLLEGSRRFHLLSRIAQLFRFVYPRVFYASLATHMLISLIFFRKAISSATWGFAIAVLSSCAALAAILSYIHVTSFPGIEPRYTAPLSTMTAIYIGLTLSSLRDLTRCRSHNGLDRPAANW